MIKNRLRILLAEKGINANQLSLQTGISASTLSKIVNNQSKQIDYQTINKICNALKITPEQLLEYKPDEDEEKTIFNIPIHMDVEKIPKRIKNARKAKGMTMKQFAKLMGRTQTVVVRWENGKSCPSLEKINKMSEVLEVEIGYLLALEVENERNL